MNYWLIKSEPGSFSWDDMVKADVEPWDGVRNYQARNNMIAMEKGDKAFFYHSVNEKQIVGVVKVHALAHPDPRDDTGTWQCVDFKVVGPVKKLVTLDDIKAEPGLKDMVLVNNSRLSVQPVAANEWKAICKMAGVKA